MKTLCNGVHCRCMDHGGLCQNMHWYHCKEHNPNALPKNCSSDNLKNAGLTEDDIRILKELVRENIKIIEEYKGCTDFSEDNLDEMVRDFSSVFPKSKSEIRERIQSLLNSQAQEILEEVKEIITKYIK